MAGLKDKTKKAIERLFTLFKSFQEDFTLKKIVKGTYNPITGTQEQTVSTYTQKCIYMNYGEYAEQEGTYERNDLAIMLLQSRLAVTPTVQDRVVFHDKEYTIISIEQDSAQFSWTLQIRLV